LDNLCRLIDVEGSGLTALAALGGGFIPLMVILGLFVVLT
jgi:hypothetical protein